MPHDDRHGFGQIWIAEADLSGPVKLTRGSAKRGWPVWSPDGTKLAIDSDREGERRDSNPRPPGPQPGDTGSCGVSRGSEGVLAFLQADTVAEHIAADAGAHAFERPFDPISMCIMEMFDKATFAQVPLELTGDPARPVTVRPGANSDYKVGTSTTWRLGKKMLGATVPMRFHAGEPFHAGLAWQTMDVGLKGMSAVLADKAAVLA